MKLLFKIFSVVLLVIMLACDNDKSKHDNQVVDNKLLEELLVKNNVDLLKKESDLIDDYVKRNRGRQPLPLSRWQRARLHTSWAKPSDSR